MIVNKSNELVSESSILDYINYRRYINLYLYSQLGGFSSFVHNAPDPLYRIDGAWYVCLDGWLAPRVDNCRVLSFGINDDFTFDYVMNDRFGCDVHSFDPFIEAKYFADIRARKAEFSRSIELDVKPKWKFYRYKITLFISFNHNLYPRVFQTWSDQ